MGQNNGLKSSTNRRQLLPKPRQVNPRLSAAVGLKRSKTTHYFWIARRRTRRACKPSVRGQHNEWVETGL